MGQAVDPSGFGAASVRVTGRVTALDAVEGLNVDANDILNDRAVSAGAYTRPRLSLYFELIYSKYTVNTPWTTPKHTPNTP
jgi:hypothetical protein